MILIALGTQKFQLNRLLIQIDELIKEGKLKEEVFGQIGNSTYTPINYKYKRFLDKDEFEDKIKECTLLITHSGVGTIVLGLKYNRPIIVYPRLLKYKEHVDDHQIEIADSFTELNYVLQYKEGDCLNNLIDTSRNHTFSKYKSQREKMLVTIQEYLESI